MILCFGKFSVVFTNGYLADPKEFNNFIDFEKAFYDITN